MRVFEKRYRSSQLLEEQAIFLNNMSNEGCCRRQCSGTRVLKTRASQLSGSMMTILGLVVRIASLVKLPEEYSYSSAMFYNCNKQPGLTISDYKIYF